MRKSVFIPFLLLIASMSASAQTLKLADPTIFHHDGKYILAGTDDVNYGFTLYTSTDLVHWKSGGGKAKGNRLLYKDDSYGTGSFWAPQLFCIGDSFGIAYAADEHVAIAFSKNVLGPYKQSKQCTVYEDTKTIDPFVFIDDDSTAYLFHVRLTGENAIWVSYLNDDMQTIKNSGSRKCVGAVSGWENTTGEYAVCEGPSVIKDNGMYYLLYSCNDYRNIDYAVGYAYAKSPLGPWTKASGPILSRHHLGINGTGHGDLFRDPDGQLWYVFHVHASNTAVQTRRTMVIPVSLTDNTKAKFKFDFSRAYFLDASAPADATLPEAATYFTIDGITYIITGEYSCSVTFPNGQSFGYKGNIEIPSTVANEGKGYIVTGITHDAFYKSSTLKSLVLPSTIQSVGYMAFEGCTALKSITFLGKTPPTATDAIANTTVLARAVVKVPEVSLVDWQTADGWKEFRHIEGDTEHAMTAIAGPTMGWSSWNTYGINISDKLIRAQADACVNKGFSDAGYKYINIDDGYFYKRDPEDGHLLIHPTKFPNGLKPVVDYIHSRGLKAGIYTDAGDNTCASAQGESWGDPWGMGSGIWEHEQQDMDFWFVDCGFDFIKVDYCGARRLTEEGLVKDEEQRYIAIAAAMRAAAAKAGRDDLRLNICRWAYPGTWAYDIADSWRTTGDIYCSWESVKGIVEENIPLSAFCRDGHYNDMDMLEVGRGLTEEEDRTHFALWCIMASPLLIGCDMRNVSSSALELLTNPELIALNQDTLHLQAYPAAWNGKVYTLVKDIETLQGNTRAVALYNPTDYKQNATLNFTDIDLAGTIRMRDLISRTDLTDVTSGTFTVTLPPHATRVYRVEGEWRTERTNYEAECAWLSDYSETGKSDVEGYAKVNTCSCGYKIGWLGKRPENDLQWQDVYAYEGGKYRMTIYFLSKEDRTIYYQVNGEKAKNLTVNSGDWDKVASRVVAIELKQGWNTIRLFNEKNWMPDIDRMTLKPVSPSIIDQPMADTSRIPSRTTDLWGRELVDPLSLPKGTVYIEGGKKRIR